MGLLVVDDNGSSDYKLLVTQAQRSGRERRNKVDREQGVKAIIN